MVTREEVEGCVGGEGGTAVVQVGVEGVALVVSWAGLGGSGLNIEISVLLAVLLGVASNTAAANE